MNHINSKLQLSNTQSYSYKWMHNVSTTREKTYQKQRVKSFHAAQVFELAILPYFSDILHESKELALGDAPLFRRHTLMKFHGGTNQQTRQTMSKEGASVKYHSQISIVLFCATRCL